MSEPIPDERPLLKQDSSFEAFASDAFRRYAEDLLRIAEEKISAKLRAKVAPEDIVQSAFKSFFRRVHQFQFDEESPDAIWGLLVVITIRKCNKWVDVFQTEKRDVQREITSRYPSSHAIVRNQATTREPGPEEACMVSDLIERLLSELAPRQREMLLLRIHGYELVEIAARCQSSRRTVARTIAEAKDLLRKILAEDNHSANG